MNYELNAYILIQIILQFFPNCLQARFANAWFADANDKKNNRNLTQNVSNFVIIFLNQLIGRKGKFRLIERMR